jgi:hypothetical protein
MTVQRGHSKRPKIFSPCWPTRGRRAKLPYFLIVLRGGGQTILHCAHRATTALSWGSASKKDGCPPPHPPILLSHLVLACYR